MQCPTCKQDFSESVFPHHVERCSELESSSAPSNMGQDELTELRQKAAELGIENADRKGERRLREEIAAAERAVADFAALRARADELLIDDFDNKDVETLKAEIAAAEADL